MNDKVEMNLVDIKERQVSLRTELKFHKDLDFCIKKLKKKLLSDFKDGARRKEQQKIGLKS